MRTNCQGMNIAVKIGPVAERAIYHTKMMNTAIGDEVIVGMILSSRQT